MKAHQRGAAILMAMLTVTLVATFAAAALWQQWRSVEVESAERSRIQSSWILTGALDWARLILREDARANPGVDHLAEPWAVPLEEARLSTFLAADRSAAVDPDSEAENTFLSGQIIDQQSLLNVNNLAARGQVSDKLWLPKFQRLFDLLGLPASQLNTFAENLRFASDMQTDNLSSREARLTPTRVEQLVWLGLPLETVAALQPYVTVLPLRTTVNLNTASAEVIYAALEGISMADAQKLVAERERSHFRRTDDARQLLAPQYAGAFSEGTVAVSSDYFEVIGRLRLNDVIVQERSLVFRKGTLVNTLYRERGVADATALSQAAAGPKR